METTAAALLNLSANMLYLETNPPTSYSEVRPLHYRCPSRDWVGPSTKFWVLREPSGVTGKTGIKNRPCKGFGIYIVYRLFFFFFLPLTVFTKNIWGDAVTYENVVICGPSLTLCIWINVKIFFFLLNYWFWFLCVILCANSQFFVYIDTFEI